MWKFDAPEEKEAAPSTVLMIENLEGRKYGERDCGMVEEVCLQDGRAFGKPTGRREVEDGSGEGR